VDDGLVVAVRRGHRHPVANGREFAPAGRPVTEPARHVGQWLSALEVHPVEVLVLEHHAAGHVALGAPGFEVRAARAVPAVRFEAHRDQTPQNTLARSWLEALCDWHVVGFGARRALGLL